MIPWTTDYPGVTIVVPSSSIGRFTMFELSLEGVQVPAGTQVVRVLSASIAKNLNTGIRESMSMWYWFIDDDHQFNQDLLLKLLAHNQPVIAAVTCVSRPPFHPVIYKGEELLPSGNKMFRNYSWAELDQKHGVESVFAVGRPGMLIRRDILEKVGDPWYECGKTNPEESGEDLYFCEKLRKLGIPILVDFDLFHGHIAPCAAWPHRLPDGTWVIRLQWENNVSILINRRDKPPIQTVAHSIDTPAGITGRDLLKTWERK